MKFLNLILYFLILINGFQAQAEEQITEQISEKTSGIRAGPSLAVLEANLKDGFRLAEKAKTVIGLVTKPLGSKPHVIPQSALVNYGDSVGVYRLRNGWFKLIEIGSSEKLKASVVTSSSELKDDDQVAIAGVALLRVSELDAFGGGQ